MGYPNLAVTPPSTTIVWPVIYDDSPLHKNKYVPYFFGEFDGEGRLLNVYDPFLYWYLPIVKVPMDYEQPSRGAVTINVIAPEPEKGKWLDCLEIHAARPFKVKAEQNR